jgi:hypothetical protein
MRTPRSRRAVTATTSLRTTTTRCQATDEVVRERWQIAAREFAALCAAQLTKLPASAGASTVAAKDVWYVI